MKKILLAVLISCFIAVPPSMACTGNCDEPKKETPSPSPTSNKVEVNNEINYSPKTTNVQNQATLVQNAPVNTVVGGATNVTATGGNANSDSSANSNSSATVGDVAATLHYQEVKQYPVPGEINSPGILLTSTPDAAGPTVYKAEEIVYLQYLFTREQLADMAGNDEPDMRGDLLRKVILPESEWSSEVAFYLEIPPNLKKQNIRQLGMIMLDANSAITTAELFGRAGLEAVKRGANAVFFTGTGFQREDKAFTFGPGASITSPAGQSLSTVALPFVFAKRWKDDEAFVRATAAVISTAK